MSDDDRAAFSVAGFQRWRSLLFVHWEVPPALLRPLVAPELEIDSFEGKAYVGLIPFEIPEARPLRSLPPVPTASHFLETNLRTYVRLGGKPGIWFFSLDAESLLAVLGARAVFGLPYFRAAMTMTSGVTGVHYTSRRAWPGSVDGQKAELTVEYRTGQDLGTATPGTLEHFLIERYTLFARHPVVGLLRADVRHQPYPLKTAMVSQLDETLTAAAHIRGLGARAPDLFSPGVDVEISPPLKAHSRVS
jgi:uncharacterized protein